MSKDAHSTPTPRLSSQTPETPAEQLPPDAEREASPARSPARSLDDVDGTARKRRAREQEWLLPYQNPLPARFDREFFAGIPRGPGVYLMYGTLFGSPDGPARDILYVGKAKNLRARLLSYRRARPDTTSRKVIRLINRVREIRWEECESEQAALLRENSLLREHRPAYNVVNTAPESYYFVALEARERELRLRLTTTPTPEPGAEALELFGAYKGRSAARAGYSALLRLLWAALGNGEERFMFPSRLCAAKPCHRCEIPVAAGLPEADRIKLARLLRRFLKGTSRALLADLTERLLAIDCIPPFCYRVIQDDLETLAEFFERGPHRNRRLRRASGLSSRSHLIAQESIDDLIVVHRFSSAPGSGAVGTRAAKR